MKTYNIIIETIKSEISNKQITTVQECRSRIEELCIQNDCVNNLLPISYDLGVA